MPTRHERIAPPEGTPTFMPNASLSHVVVRVDPLGGGLDRDDATILSAFESFVRASIEERVEVVHHTGRARPPQFVHTMDSYSVQGSDVVAVRARAGGRAGATPYAWWFRRLFAGNNSDFVASHIKKEYAHVQEVRAFALEGKYDMRAPVGVLRLERAAVGDCSDAYTRRLILEPRSDQQPPPGESGGASHDARRAELAALSAIADTIASSTPLEAAGAGGGRTPPSEPLMSGNASSLCHA